MLGPLQSLETLTKRSWRTLFWTLKFFRFFRFVNLPNIGLMLSSGDLDLRSGPRDFLFLLAAGLRDLGAGLRSLGSGVAGFGFPHPGSIYTYSRSTAPAAVMLSKNIKNGAAKKALPKIHQRSILGPGLASQTSPTSFQNQRKIVSKTMLLKRSFRLLLITRKKEQLGNPLRSIT